MTKPLVVVGVHEAKTGLSELLRLVDAGQEVEIHRSGVPVARLVPPAGRRPRVFGLDRGRFTVPDDFDAPLNSGVLDAFGRYDVEVIDAA